MKQYKPDRYTFFSEFVDEIVATEMKETIRIQKKLKAMGEEYNKEVIKAARVLLNYYTY